VARQPICDRNQRTFGYELLFRNSATNAALIGNPESATADVIVNSLMEIGLDRLVGSSVGFINVTRDFIVGGYCHALPRDRVILEILEDVSPDQELITEVQKLRKLGYRFALDDFTFQEKAKLLLPLGDIVKVDLRQSSRETIQTERVELQRTNKIMLAEKVETREEFEFSKECGFVYFQGYFFCRPDLFSKVAIPVNRVQLFRLLAELNKPDITPSHLAKTIGEDLSLSYKLLRYINSAFLSLPHQIESIGHAVQMVGLHHIRMLASLVLLSTIDEKPKELITVSLIRAKMCELLAVRFKYEPGESFFTVGLFSSLDAFLDKPIETALESLPLSDRIRDALIGYSGDLGRVLKMVVDYEQTCLDRDSADFQVLEDVYWRAVDWQSELIKGFGSLK